MTARPWADRHTFARSARHLVDRAVSRQFISSPSNSPTRSRRPAAPKSSKSIGTPTQRALDLQRLWTTLEAGRCRLAAGRAL